MDTRRISRSADRRICSAVVLTLVLLVGLPSVAAADGVVESDSANDWTLWGGPGATIYETGHGPTASTLRAVGLELGADYDLGRFASLNGRISAQWSPQHLVGQGMVGIQGEVPIGSTTLAAGPELGVSYLMPTVGVRGRLQHQFGSDISVGAEAGAFGVFFVGTAVRAAVTVGYDF